MAVLKMRRLFCVVEKKTAPKFIKQLQSLGCVEVRPTDDLRREPELGGYLRANGGTVLYDNVAALDNALNALRKYTGAKKGMLEQRPQAAEADFENELQNGAILEKARTLLNYNEVINKTLSDDIKLQAQLNQLMPYEALDLPLDFKGGEHFSVLFGTLPDNVIKQAVHDSLSQKAPESFIEFFGAHMGLLYTVVVCHNAVLADCVAELKSLSFVQIVHKDFTGTAAENIEKMQLALQQNEEARQEALFAIDACVPQRAELEIARDAYFCEYARLKLGAGLTSTEKTAFVAGYTPLECEASVEELFVKFGCAYTFEDPTEQEFEQVPIKLRNSRLVRPFEMITSMYALPTYKTHIDPNFFVSIFYSIFFGMMFADIAYGLILVIATGVILKKSKPPLGGSRNMFELLFLCGISSAIWGVLFGSFFGDSIPVITQRITGTAFTFKPLLFDPLEEPMLMFYISLAFGVVHIAVGMAIKAYNLIRDGDVFGAISEIGFWYMLIGGLISTLLGFAYGLHTAAVGAAGILLFTKRGEKNIVKRIFGGLGALYGMTSYLSDILSYSRLLALGLASAVIAKVFNLLGGLGGTGILGWVLFIMVFIIGHVFNIAINALGTFVHTSRLQFIEFFSKFYDSGGLPFTPFSNSTEFVDVVEDKKN